MAIKKILFLFFVLGATCWGSLYAVDFIPLEALFADRQTIDVEISPGGQYLLGQKYVEKKEWRRSRWRKVTFVMNLETGSLVPVVDPKESWLTFYHWVSDDRFLVRLTWPDMIYALNADGSAFTKLIQIDSARNQYQNRHLDKAYFKDVLIENPDKVLFAQMVTSDYVGGKYVKYLDYEGTLSGMFQLDVHTGEATQIVETDFPIIKWIIDAHGNPVYAVGNQMAELSRYGEILDEDYDEKLGRRHYFTQELYAIENGKLSEPLAFAPSRDLLEKDIHLKFSFINESGELSYLSNRKTDKVSLVEWSRESNQEKVLVGLEKVDIERLMFDPWAYRYIGYVDDSGRREYIYTDADLATVKRLVDRLLPGRVNYLANWDRSFNRFIVFSFSSRDPGEYYILDRKQKSLNEILNTAPELAEYEFSSKRPVSYACRDGYVIHGYLTLPIRVKEKKPGPMILLVHGGPWARDYCLFDREVQFYADRGYAVLQVNFRGSEGYGKQHLQAGKFQLGDLMQDDLTDAVHWAIDQGIADPDRIGIAGASYGGYATLMGLIKTPDLFQVGIAGMGVYNLAKLYEEDLKKGHEYSVEFWTEWVGDPDDPEELKRLKRNSPVYNVSKIQAPVFIWHGDRDGRVWIDHAFQLTKKLRKYKKPYEIKILRHEGHGVRDEEKRAELYQNIETFLTKYMPSDLMK